MKHLIMYCSHTPEFKREAEKYQKLHNVAKGDIADFSQYPKLYRARKAMQWLAAKQCDSPMDWYGAVAVFCHGWKTKTEIGFTSQDVNILAKLLYSILDSGTVITLYCCSCGKPGGFAQLLSGAFLHHEDITVISHLNSGHTTENPNVAIYRHGRDITPVEITPPGRLWKKWKKSLSNYGIMRFLFPFMTPELLISKLDKEQPDDQ